MVTNPPTTRQKIIDAGTRAVLVKSFNGAGLKEILDDAGVPKGSFYHYFKSKEELGIAVLEDAFAYLMDAARSMLLDETTSPMTRLRNYFIEGRNRVANPDQHRSCVVCKMVLEEARHSEPLRLAVKRGYERYCTMLGEVLSEAQAEGEIADDVPAIELAHLLKAMWQGAIIRSEIDGDLHAIDRFIAVGLDRLLHTQPHAQLQTESYAQLLDTAQLQDSSSAPPGA